MAYRIDDVGEVPGRPPLSAEERQALVDEWNADAARRGAPPGYRELRAIAYRDELGKEPGDFIRTFGDVLDVLIAQVEAIRQAAGAGPADEYAELLAKIAAIKARHPRPADVRL